MDEDDCDDTADSAKAFRLTMPFWFDSRRDFEELGARAGVDVFIPSDKAPVFRPG